MKKLMLWAMFLAGCAGALADGAGDSKEDAGMSCSLVIQAKAQEVSRALVQLKLEEVALGFGDPAATKKALEVVRAKEAALHEELVRLAVAPLEIQLRLLEGELEESLKVMNEKNPGVLALKEKVGKCKARIVAAKAVLEAPQDSKP